MSYFLILWDIDNSVTVVNKKSKGIVTLNESEARISFKWPRKGIYEGKIVAISGGIQLSSVTANSYQFSDSKKEMDAKANEMTRHMEKKDEVEMTRGTTEKASSSQEEQETAKNKQKPKRSAKALQKKAEVEATNKVAKQIFQKTEIQALQAEIEELKQQLKAKDVSQVRMKMVVFVKSNKINFAYR